MNFCLLFWKNINNLFVANHNKIIFYFNQNHYFSYEPRQKDKYVSKEYKNCHMNDLQLQFDNILIN